jgi:hypothetical protein
MSGVGPGAVSNASMTLMPGNFATSGCVWLDTALDRPRLGLTDIILCGVLQGVRDGEVCGQHERI